MPDRATLLPKSLHEQTRTHSIAALPCAAIQAGRRAIPEHFRIARMAAAIHLLQPESKGVGSGQSLFALGRSVARLPAGDQSAHHAPVRIMFVYT